MPRKKKKTYVNKKVRNATPLEVDNIQFKSKLEVYCYQKLQKYNLFQGYESETFELITPFTYTSQCYEHNKRTKTLKEQPKVRKMSYTPDFVFNYKGELYIVECKGFPNEQFPIKWKLFKKTREDFYQNYLIKQNLFLVSNKDEIDFMIKTIINE
jgi:hypothetical protein